MRFYFAQSNFVWYHKSMTLEEKIRLFNGDGNWKTFSAGNKLPVITMSDGPHGLRKQNDEDYADINNSKRATCFPTASCIASSWNTDSVAKMAKSIAQEALAENVNLMLGPGTNIKRSPLCGRNFEYFSEDPFLAGTLTASYINAMQEEGTGCSLKHYACNNQEYRRQTSNSIIDERTLREIYLRPFEIAVKKSQPLTVMCSYNRVNGEYAAHSKKLLTDILRTEWGFKGAVVSDWGACIHAAECLKAGMDLAMPDSFGYFDGLLKKALADKVIEEADVDKANARLLSVAEQLNASAKNVTVDFKKQHQTAYELACDSAVLLENRNFFPVEKGQIAVIGELAEYMQFQGGGSSHINTAKHLNAIESLAAQGYDVLYSKGYYSGFCTQKKIKSKNKPYIVPALELAKEAASKNIPVLFFCGLTEAYEGEGFDRKNLALPEEQTSLLEKILEITDNVGVISFSGSPVDFYFAPKVKGLLHMYLAGEACGEAVAAIVSGNVNPSGKLAETFPLKTEDIPCIKNFSENACGVKKDNVEYREGVFIGYRYFESKNIPVRYCFGYGLSYTSFEYTDMSISLPKVNVTVKNSGQKAGSEIVQLYVVNPAAEDNMRPVKELRGFAKVYLEPGESKSVEITLDENAFSVYSTRKKSFVNIEGEYKIQAASSVKDVRLEQTVTVTGEKYSEAVEPVSEEFWKQAAVVPHQKGSYTISDSLIDMSEHSFRVKLAMKFFILVGWFMAGCKSWDDPVIKITKYALAQNPLESILSTSNGSVSKKMADIILKWANR